MIMCWNILSDPKALLKAARGTPETRRIAALAVQRGSWDARLPGWNSYEPYHLLISLPEPCDSLLKGRI